MGVIYISSTYSDLVEERKAVYEALDTLERHKIVCMERYVATDQRPVDKCFKDAASCDIYIGIFAWKYGDEPRGHDGQSITEIEYRAADDSTKTRTLIFMLEPTAAWPMDRVDNNRAMRWSASACGPAQRTSAAANMEVEAFQ